MKIENRKKVFSGRAFSVEDLEVRLPDNRNAHYDLVDHIGSATIVPLDEEGNLYFVRQFRIGSEKEMLELPAGTLSPGEDPLHCAQREVREEVGMQANKISEIGNFFLAPGYSTEFMHIYLATELVPAPLPGDDDEFLTREIIPVKRAIEMVHRNEIDDCKTVAALMLALPELKRLNLYR